MFTEREREGEREVEKHQCDRETSVSCLSDMSYREGAEPATQARALTWNQTATFCWQDDAQPAEPHQSG